MIKVTYFQRRPRKGFNFSLESIFEDVRTHLRGKIEVTVQICSYYNDGIKTKFFNIWEAASRQSNSVNHITGEVHFLNLLMKRERVVLTILDCRFLNRKTGLSKFFVKWIYLKLPVWKSKLITTISEATKGDIVKFSGCHPNKVIVIPVAVNSIYKPYPEVFNNKKPEILHIGTGENKNLLRLVEALKGVNCHLSIVGKLSDEQLNKLEVCQTNYCNYYNISQEEILERYKACDILSFISTFEGFGMPIIEANTVERVVITSNISSMPEVAGDAALLVNPYNIEDIRKGIIQLRDNPVLREQLIANGRKNKMRFQAKNISEQYFKIYKEIIRNSE